MLIRKLRNQLFEALVSKNLQAKDFTEGYEGGTYKIKHSDDRFSFHIHGEDELFKVFYWPLLRGTEGIDNWRDWTTVLFNFSKWLAIVKDEFDTPDLWSIAQESSGFLSSSQNLSDEKFSVDEIQLISERLKTVEAHIATLNLPEAAKEAIIGVARDIPKEAAFFTKKKLAEVVIGQLISQGLKWGLTTEHMQVIWHTFQEFTQLFLN